MKVPNLESMINKVVLEVRYTVCENCLMYLNEHKLISQGVRETNEDYTLLLVCPPVLINPPYRLALGVGFTEDTCFKSSLMNTNDAIYYAHQHDQYNY